LNNRSRFRIGIIGSGVVGSTTGKAFHKLGHEVIFYDILKDTILSLKKDGYQVASNINDIISKTDISFICVDTPTNKKGQQDLSRIMSVLFDLTHSLNNYNAKSVGTNKSSSPHLIVFRSTILPGTMKNVIINYLEKNCSLERGKDYNVCYNPEFLRKHAPLDDFFNPDRVVIGEDNKGVPYQSSSPLQELYKEITNNIIITDYDTAEMIKYASNCFLSLKISYFNEIGLLCRQLGIDHREVSMAVAQDKRIGQYGTHAGRSFKGPCLPKDTQALAYFVKRSKLKPDLIQSILDINERLAREQEEGVGEEGEGEESIDQAKQTIEETVITSPFNMDRLSYNSGN
jgi:nucleotide sugar dehydrogenase